MKLTRILFLLLVTAGAFAAEPVRFQIESIEVTGGGARIQSIVIAQSLLREGQTYSEAELADAVSRIRRLPFVRAVSFSLAKGTERGLYRLVITVDPMMSLFFDAQARSASNHYQDQTRTDTYGALTAGGRIPVGSSGMARATVSGAELFDNMVDSDSPHPQPTFAVGYSLYRIGSRAIFADLTLVGTPSNAATPFNDGEIRYGAQTSVQAIVGVPIHGSQSIRAELSLHRSPVTFQSANQRASGASQYTNAQLFWLRDTTDDPLYPLHGSLVKGGLFGSKGRSAGVGLGFPPGNGPDPIVSLQKYDSYGVETAASHYWTFSNERALSFHGSYQVYRTDFKDLPFQTRPYESERFSVGTGFTKRLSGPNTDAWLNVSVDAQRFDWTARFDMIRGQVELAHRSKWGVARIGLSYSGQRN